MAWFNPDEASKLENLEEEIFGWSKLLILGVIVD